MSSNKNGLLAQYHIGRVLEGVETYNRAARSLFKAWDGPSEEFPVEEIPTMWHESVENGDRAVETDLLIEIGKEIELRHKQVDESRSADAEMWTATRIRDIQHSAIDRVLGEIRQRLDETRELV